MVVKLSPENHSGEPVKLSKRESQVLALTVEGLSPKEMADALFCSKRTIDFHLASIYKKLRVTNRVQAMRRATHLDLI